ncbi:MAG: creatininase family protein [Anaerolineales bacterium]|nr:creatininase family protein [Chloroflexota bacterium]MBL6981677.1 creatininase family protein [Anaerolineales bacterium]
MRYSDLNWFDVENYLENDDRLMIVLGSCEQHGYLSLLTDTKIPLAFADAASQKNDVLVAPPLNFGASPYFLAYPGTISLRIATLMNVIEDIIRSVYKQGFRRVLLLNGHGGNEPVRGRMYELANEMSDLRIAWYTWWDSHSVEVILQKHELKSFHAGWIEAYNFTRVAELPKGEKTPPHITGLLGAEEARQVYGDGVFGGAYQVDDAIMQEIFDTCVDDVVQILKFE